MNNVERNLNAFILKKSWLTVSAVLLVGGLLASAIWIFLPYSYWLDELYSVTAANEPLRSLHQILLGDVHPPLYQLTLKLWITLFGDSEQSTRFMSWIFAIAAAIYLCRKTGKYGKVFSIVAILFFITNGNFAFYANETRSYAMALFFATVLIANYPNDKTKPPLTFLVAGLVLSLTHYFGLIITGVTFSLYILQNLRQPKILFSTLFTGLLCLVWPLYHISTGELLGRTGGNFWIKSDGFFDSLGIAAAIYLPKTGVLGGIILVAGLVLVTAITYPKRENPLVDNASLSVITRNSAVISLLFVGIIGIIDLWSPMSTGRNYIVLLPFISISLAGAFSLIIKRYDRLANYFFAVFFIYCALALIVSYRGVYNKSLANQDWRGAALYIIENHNGRELYYLTNDEKKYWSYLVSNFYLKKFSENKLEAQPYVVGKTQSQKPKMIQVGHQAKNVVVINTEMRRIGAIQSYVRKNPVDIKTGAVGVYVTD